jgi:hypothetical protein
VFIDPGVLRGAVYLTVRARWSRLVAKTVSG